MPDRILRAGILKSESVNLLSWPAEVFYRRLMSVVDDYGRYDGRTLILRADLYALKESKVSVTDVDKWKAECAKTGLISCYQVAGKEYLELLNFGQRLRAMKSKYPGPADICQQMPADDSGCPPESDTDTEADIETETEKNTDGSGAIAPPSFKNFNEQDFYNSIARFAKAYPKKMLRDFFDYWRETTPSGVMLFQLKKTWDTNLRLQRWQRNNFEKAGKKEDSGPIKNSTREAKDADMLNQIDG